MIYKNGDMVLDTVTGKTGRVLSAGDGFVHVDFGRNSECIVKETLVQPVTWTKSPTKENKDEVKHRADHYARLNPEPIEYMQKAFSHDEFRGYLLGNIVKYSLRFGHKDSRIKEAAKIDDYAKWLYDHEQNKKVSL